MDVEAGAEDRVAELEELVKQLESSKDQQAREFGEGRAKLKQLYMQKEEEVRLLGVELEEANSRVVIAECTAENRVEAEQRKCREELATVHQLCREDVAAAVAEERERYEAELQQLKRQTARLDADRKKYRHLYHQLKEAEQQLPQSPPSSLLSPGVLSGITKSIIAKHVPGLNTTTSTAATQASAVTSTQASAATSTQDSAVTSTQASSALTTQASAATSTALAGAAQPGSSELRTAADAQPVASTPVPTTATGTMSVAPPVAAGEGVDGSLQEEEEQQQQVVQDDVALLDNDEAAATESRVLQELVTALQEEVRVLRERLDGSGGGLMGADTADPAPAAASLQHSAAADEQSSLAAEKSSRADLELYTSILNAQKVALSNQLTALRTDADRWRKLYEGERSELSELRATWQRANDHFLSSQRHSLALTQRLRDMLTDEQLTHLRRLSDKDEEDCDWGSGSDEELDDVVAALPSSTSIKQSPRPPPHSLLGEHHKLLPDVTRTSGGDLDEEEEEDESNILEEVMLPERNSGGSSSPRLAAEQGSAASGGGAVLSSRYSPEKLPRLTDDQRKALQHSLDNSDDEAALSSAVAGAGGVAADGSGGRMVSEWSWRRLQRDLRTTKAKLARPCQACRSSQQQVHELQSKLDSSKSARGLLEKAVERQVTELKREAQYRRDTEDQWLRQLEEYQEKESVWSQRMEEAGRRHGDLLAKWRGAVAALHHKMTVVTEDREHTYNQLHKMYHENSRMAGKFMKTAQQLQDEMINLPTTMEEMQLLLLRLKEDVIIAKVSKETTEENLNATIALLQEQLLREEVERRRLDEGSRRENRELRDMVSRLQSTASQEQHTEEAQQQEVQLLQAVKRELVDMSKMKHDLEGNVAEQRQRVTALQHDLDLSEQTQRDFVRLSQSLQVQLEKIRQSDSEVRWQHEDDVDECNNCKQRFTSLRRKHHCRHCGKVFCGDCVGKSVTAGRSNRQCRVCDVCHTLLVPHATPYFSATHDTK